MEESFLKLSKLSNKTKELLVDFLNKETLFDDWSIKILSHPTMIYLVYDSHSYIDEREFIHGGWKLTDTRRKKAIKVNDLISTEECLQ